MHFRPRQLSSLQKPVSPGQDATESCANSLLCLKPWDLPSMLPCPGLPPAGPPGLGLCGSKHSGQRAAAGESSGSFLSSRTMDFYRFSFRVESLSWDLTLEHCHHRAEWQNGWQSWWPLPLGSPFKQIDKSLLRALA